MQTAGRFGMDLNALEQSTQEMELQHVNVKIPVDGAMGVDPARFIPIFHEWIREESLGGLLIDVADYRHVPAGPGAMLIAFEADYNMDNADDVWGMRYNRKTPLDGSNTDRFRQALAAAAGACLLLEKEFAAEGGLTFSRSAFELFINDRAIAPNTPETWGACEGELKAFVVAALGHEGVTLTPQADSRRLFGATITAAKPFDLAAIAAL